MSATITEPATPPRPPAHPDEKHAVHVCQLDANDDPAGWPLIAMCGHHEMSMPAPAEVPLCDDCDRAMTARRPCPVCGQVP